MNNLKQIISWTNKSKVLERIGNLKRFKFQKIDTWNTTSLRKENLYQHKCKWYSIDEIDSQFWRNPLNLDWVSYSFDKGWKEFLVYSQQNILLEVYPQLKLAKDLIEYSIENNIDFSVNSLSKWVHYKAKRE